MKLLNLKLPGALPAWGPPRALCRGKAQAEFTESRDFVKMEVNHFTCTLLKTAPIKAHEYIRTRRMLRRARRLSRRNTQRK